MSNSNVFAFPTRAIVSPIAQAIVEPAAVEILAPSPAPKLITGELMPTLAPIVATDYKGVESELFRVESEAIYTSKGLIPNKRSIEVLGNSVNIVSGRYEIHQPVDIYAEVERVALETGMVIRKVITNKATGGLMISMLFDNISITGESHDVNLTFYTSHCGKYKTFLSLDLLRIACFNQVPALYKNKSRHLFAEKHYQGALDVSLIGELLTHIPESVQAYADQADLLRTKPMSQDQFAELFADHYKLSKEQKQYDSKIEKARSLWANATGQRELESSAYKAYQAVTFANTHSLRNTAQQAENVITKASDDSLKFLARLLAA